MKKRLLLLLIFIFLCACTFIDNNKTKPMSTANDVIFLEQYNDIVEKVERHVNYKDTIEVRSVFQHQTDQIWKIEFSNGTIVLYDEKNGEIKPIEE